MAGNKGAAGALWLGLSVAATGALLGVSSGLASDLDPICESGKPHLVIAMEEGSIRIELYEKAAPRAVRQLVRLTEGPIFNSAVLPSSESAATIGYYDGLSFDYTQPNVEIAVPPRAPADLIQLKNEISAKALGLHEEKIENVGEAMDVMQRELLPAHQAVRKQGTTIGRLGKWIDDWYEERKPNFLVGVSRQEINEALGHVYVEGLESLPAVRGAVAFKPSSPGWSTPGLSILLADIPQRNGILMVVGRVINGLGTAQDISLRPRVPGQYGDRWFRPVNPVVIESMRFECI